MKKIIIFSFYILAILSINISYGFEAIKSNLSEINSINCDLIFNGELRKGKSTSFSDNFSNGNNDIKINDIQIHYYENFTNNSNFPSFDYTNWLKGKNNIIGAGENGKIVQSSNLYNINGTPNQKSYDNLKIKYTVKYFPKNSNGQFSTTSIYHTECKNYKISYCGDGIVDNFYGETCDPNDTSKKNWGTKGCSNTCEPENIPVKNPVCNSSSASVKIGTESLNSVITCKGNDVNIFKINCGNGQVFTNYGNNNGFETFSKTCNYSKPGIYKVQCIVDNLTPPNSCKQNIIVKNKYITPPKIIKPIKKEDTKVVNKPNIKPEIKEESKKINNDLKEYEKYIKQTIFDYKKNKIILKIKEKEESKTGMGLIKLPKILPKTGTPVEKRVKKLYNPKVEVNFIESKFRLAGNYNTNLDFWRQVLPTQDKNAKKYIVIPSVGLVMPINEVPEKTKDFNTMVSGYEINVNKYLKTGAMEYPKTSLKGYGEVGNKVIFAHSSYFKKDNGRYKTDFGKIISLDPGEEIWIYEKINGNYKLFKYKTIKSYNTKPTNVSVLKPGVGKKLTLFTCTPIGGIDGRWIIEAKYIDKEKEKLENEIQFKNIDYKTKSKINSLVKNIAKLDKQDKQEKILKIFKEIIKKEKEIKNKKNLNIMKYLKLKLALEYYN